MGSVWLQKVILTRQITVDRVLLALVAARTEFAEESSIVHFRSSSDDKE